MKILMLDVNTVKWVPLDLPLEAKPSASTYRIELSDDQVIEVSEEQDSKGLHYMAVMTPTGILAIYPDGANKILFRVVDDR